MMIFVVYTCSASDLPASTPCKSAVYVPETDLNEDVVLHVGRTHCHVYLDREIKKKKEKKKKEKKKKEKKKKEKRKKEKKNLDRAVGWMVLEVGRWVVIAHLARRFLVDGGGCVHCSLCSR